MSESNESVLREQLADVPFETLLRMQRQSEHRLASTVRGDKPPAAAAAAAAAQQRPTRKTKRAKDAPAELPSNVPVSRFRQVVHMPRNPPVRDPRFDDLSGNFNAGLFRKVRLLNLFHHYPSSLFIALCHIRTHTQSYAFLEEMRDEEIAELRQSLQQAKRRTHQQRRDADEMQEDGVDEEVEKMKTALSILEQQKRADEEAAQKHARKVAWRKATEERIARGGKAFFMKHRDAKREAAIAKYYALKAKGGSKSVEATIERRERKKAAKQRKRPLFRARNITE